MLLKKKICAMTIFMLSLAMFFSSCDFDKLLNPSNNHLYRFSGRVYESEIKNPMLEGENIIRIPYNGRGVKIFSNDLGGEGEIENGGFQFTIGVPAKLESILPIINDEFKDLYTDIRISDRNAQGAFLELKVNLRGLTKTLNKEKSSFTLTKKNSAIDTLPSKSNTLYFVREEIVYIYVDRDVIINGKGISKSEKADVLGNVTYTTSDFMLNLREGWNPVYTKTQTEMYSIINNENSVDGEDDTDSEESGNNEEGSDGEETIDKEVSNNNKVSITFDMYAANDSSFNWTFNDPENDKFNLKALDFYTILK